MIVFYGHLSHLVQKESLMYNVQILFPWRSKYNMQEYIEQKRNLISVEESILANLLIITARMTAQPR